jgi:2-hydroxy-6-oxonona-2,4-dienedioate hydrolase
MGHGQSTHLSVTRSRVGRWEIHALRTTATPGDRPPIVLVHGWGVAGGYLYPLAGELATDFTVYVPDLPGHGLSSKPRHALTLDDLADTLAAWMRASGIEKSVLVGQSFGCQIATRLAEQHPGRLRALVLIGPTVDARARNLPRQIRRLMLASVWEPVSLLPLIARDYVRMGLRRLAGELRWMFADAIEQRLPGITVPSLVIRGARDAVVPRQWASEVAALLGGADVVPIPGGGHAVQYGHPGAVAQMIRDFVGVVVSGRNRPMKDCVRSDDPLTSAPCPSPDPISYLRPS